MTIPVACQRLGPIGLQIALRLAQRPGVEVVTAVDHAPAKVGQDLGALAAVRPSACRSPRRCRGVPMAGPGCWSAPPDRGSQQ